MIPIVVLAQIFLCDETIRNEQNGTAGCHNSILLFFYYFHPHKKDQKGPSKQFSSFFHLRVGFDSIPRTKTEGCEVGTHKNVQSI